MATGGIKLKVRAASFPKWKKITKEVRFGIAEGLTKTAEEGQRGVILNLKKSFTIRTPWWEPRRKTGIRVRKAKGNKLDQGAAVQTAADFLVDHEKGGRRTFTSPSDRTGRRHHSRSLKYRSIPQFMRKSARNIMLKSQKPSAILKQKKVFMRKTPRGWAIYRLVGKQSFKGGKMRRVSGKTQLQKLFILRRSVTIRKRPAFTVPAVAAMKKHYKRSMIAGMNEAMRKMDPYFRKAARSARAR